LLSGALLDYGTRGADELDAALLVHHLDRAMADIAGRAVRSAEYLRVQWKLPSPADILRGQM
jgi:hypothetical protein